MSETLTRIDATWGEPGREQGRVSIFGATQGYVEIKVGQLLAAGWRVEVRPIEVAQLIDLAIDRRLIHRLICECWPCLPLAQILDLVRVPTARQPKVRIAGGDDPWEECNESFGEERWEPAKPGDALSDNTADAACEGEEQGNGETGGK